MTACLALSVPADQLFPADAAFMARTDATQMRLLGVGSAGPDSVTTHMIGLWSGRPTVRHRAGATEGILRLFDDAGIDISEDMHLYHSADEAEEAAARLIDAGHRLYAIYPLPHGRWPDAAQVVPPAVWHALNAKAGIAALFDPGHLAHRQVLTVSAARARPFAGPVWVKLGGAVATALGYGLRFCPDAAAYAAAITALADLDGTGAPIIVEDHVAIGTCWCANIVVTSETTLFAGSAAQVFAAPGQQIGNRIDPDDPMPDAAIPIVTAAGEAARRLGFTGVAGLDLGQAGDGRIVVFDPNFRMNASTPQILFHPAAAARSGLAVSQSLALTTGLPMPVILARLRGMVRDHLFVPTRLLDAALITGTEGKSAVNGFVMARCAAEAAARAATVVSMLSYPAP